MRSLFASLLFVSLATAQAQPAPVIVAASTPDLASIVREIGGELVKVTTFVKGSEDPHFVEPRPSFVRTFADAELWVHVGLELEIGWAPVLLAQSHNARVQPGTPGFLDASTAITPLGVATGKVDRSMGDVHAGGNPHYLLAPRNGWLVACKVRDALVALRPAEAKALQARCDAFSERLGSALLGKRLATKYEWEKLAALQEHGKLDAFLKAQGDAPAEGWVGLLAPFRGAPIVVDHDLWPYFARTFGLETVATLEPLPGVPPTTKHLANVIATAKQRGVRAVLASPYFDVRHAQMVARECGAKVLAMAHQTGARPGTDEYVAMLDANVRRLAEALAGTR